jgi:hypothetical protein
MTYCMPRHLHRVSTQRHRYRSCRAHPFAAQLPLPLATAIAAGAGWRAALSHSMWRSWIGLQPPTSLQWRRRTASWPRPAGALHTPPSSRGNSEKYVSLVARALTIDLARSAMRDRWPRSFARANSSRLTAMTGRSMRSAFGYERTPGTRVGGELALARLHRRR